MWGVCVFCLFVGWWWTRRCPRWPSIDVLFPECEWSVGVGTCLLSGEGSSRGVPSSLVLRSALVSPPLLALSSAWARAGGPRGSLGPGSGS